MDLEIEFRVPLRQRVEALRPDIVALCEQYGAHHVEVFGSVAAGTAVDESDLDLLVDLDDDADLLTLVRLERELSELLGVDVDVVPRSTVDESFRGSATSAAGGCRAATAGCTASRDEVDAERVDFV